MSSNAENADSTGADDLVVLYTCGSSEEAALLRAALTSAEIYCVVQGMEHRSMLGVLGSYIEPKVMVRKTDLPAAKEIIADHERAAPALEDLPPELADADHDDSSPAPDRRRRVRIIAMVILGFMGLPLLLGVWARVRAAIEDHNAATTARELYASGSAALSRGDHEVFQEALMKLSRSCGREESAEGCLHAGRLIRAADSTSTARWKAAPFFEHGCNLGNHEACDELQSPDPQ
jgi:hypothetical protein